MNKISDTLEEVISTNSFLQFGITQDLLNLSKLAKFLNPIIAAKTKKEVSNSAILMQLSRLKKRIGEPSDKGLGLGGIELSGFEQEFQLEKLTVHSGLSSATFHKDKNAHKQVHELQRKLTKQNAFFTCTQGAFEITIIFPEDSYDLVKITIDEEPQFHETNLSCLVSSFAIENLEVNGLIYRILQKLYFQKINLIELASTATEISIFLKETDVRLAFDTIYNSFLVKRG